jgi:hypothetical protein
VSVDRLVIDALVVASLVVSLGVLALSSTDEVLSPVTLDCTDPDLVEGIFSFLEPDPASRRTTVDYWICRMGSLAVDTGRWLVLQVGFGANKTSEYFSYFLFIIILLVSE